VHKRTLILLIGRHTVEAHMLSRSPASRQGRGEEGGREGEIDIDAGIRFRRWEGSKGGWIGRKGVGCVCGWGGGSLQREEDPAARVSLALPRAARLAAAPTLAVHARTAAAMGLGRGE
jgi:hypothetical protein